MNVFIHSFIHSKVKEKESETKRGFKLYTVKERRDRPIVEEI